ncbi:MAG: flagellar basal body P-ring formation chaperone FlgA [Planctomycetota bacterium]
MPGVAPVRRRVAGITNRHKNNDTITRADLRADTRWMDPTAAAESAVLADAIGQRATNRLDPGSVLRTKDVEAPIAVRRGSSVVVLTVSGGVSVETTARALRDALIGERVACRLHRASAPFDAIVTGPGRVLVNLDALAVGTRDALSNAEGGRP